MGFPMPRASPTNEPRVVSNGGPANPLTYRDSLAPCFPIRNSAAPLLMQRLLRSKPLCDQTPV